MRRSLTFAIVAQVVTVVVLFYLGVQYFRQTDSLKTYTNKIERTHRIINFISLTQAAIRDAETSGRGYLLTNDKNFLKQLSSAAAVVLPLTDSLKQLVKDNKVQAKYIRRIDRLADIKVKIIIENCYRKSRISNDSLVKRLSYGRALMDSIDFYFDAMTANELVLLEQRKQYKNRFELMLPRSLRAALLTCFLMIAAFGVWIFVELKKRFHYQNQLRVKLNELRQSNEELEQIAFAASHDLQEPLRKIRIFSDRLLVKADPNQSGEQAMMLQRMNFAATKMQQLITDLVKFNQLVQNRFQHTNIDLQQMLNQAITRAIERHPGVKVNWGRQESFPLINASEEQIVILFDEIFNNAIEFKCGERNLEISLQSSTALWSQIKGLPAEINQGKFFMLMISDNGIGFDPAFRDKMFKPFQRLHNTESENNTRRKGMGLAMCKRVMLNAGGWIDADGKVNAGAVIRLYFPVSET